MSVMIISVGIVGFASAVGLASLELWFGQRDTNISMLVADELEHLKATGHDAVGPGNRTEGEFQLSWLTEGVDPKKVTLVVTYPGHDAVARADTFVTYLWP